MLILGVDTSCDDTSASVVKDGCQILSNVVSSQDFIHKKYGGIVPELASRHHIEMITVVVDESIKKANISFEDISALAVCSGPGLIGSLLVGCCFIKSVGFAKGIPLVEVNHLEGHIFSIFLEYSNLTFPFLTLIVSGGHTSLYLVEGFKKYTNLGKTRDDAAGESFDKVARLLGLGYPGGPIIDELAKSGRAEFFNFPCAYLPNTYDFSFSGIKTSVKLKIKDLQPLTDKLIKDISASFQYAIVKVLVEKVKWAMVKEGIKKITVSGGVAANSELRAKMADMIKEQNFELFLPSISLCTDNAAMIAAAGYHHFISGDMASLNLNPKASATL